ncbi:hypothetical protein [Streptomyces lavendulae]|uniref:hypothetical protein n=1 Tax=Streptomyces lavendulae TaxID=1914 RepID=UPI00368D16A4
MDRYWRLVWIVNGWQVVPDLIPVYPRLVQALRHRLRTEADRIGGADHINPRV